MPGSGDVNTVWTTKEAPVESVSGAVTIWTGAGEERTIFPVIVLPLPSFGLYCTIEMIVLETASAGTLNV